MPEVARPISLRLAPRHIEALKHIHGAAVPAVVQHQRRSREAEGRPHETRVAGPSPAERPTFPQSCMRR